MVLKNLYIARHGYRANWLPEPHPVNPTGIDSDPPLADHGVDQAKELAHYILSIEPHPEMIFTSPFYRCLQTSAPIAEVLGIDIELENGIGEWYKPDREVIPKPAGYDILKPFFPKLQQNWEPTLKPSLSGETQEQIFERSKTFLQNFIPKFEAKYPHIETIIFVTHAAAKIALGMALLGFNSVLDALDDEDTRLRAGACSLDKFERILNGKTNDNGTDWKITMNGNCEFLTNGEEMHWDFQNGFEAGSDADIKARKAAEALKNKTSEKIDLDTNQEEYEDVYVTLEIPNNNYNTNTIPATAKLQASGLHTQAPLFKVDNEIYQGDWQKLVGTEVAFTDDMEQKYVISDRIKLEDVTPS
ncbi:Transcription factor tau subunit [Wickerhamomyces ciferrii]|uniref:Transcription factor tau subunit n=1 Tax=Wickerhamomyces ciferrii (strain ATCC 14091 / BCRC 22168 / CBS 111 / JCM 3599 / NBRC 0793 / NRRL Y-1031 F-60-10) TaxID=1206466 RepID=K0KDS9_WICCF|nr:Transcription factor tau subunit [Wickerhamomyces ciferrii]CCH41081.1 Transcription factor tau subunit [Wickerhamomyces ciferrii]